jgi:hypothetical protein
VRLSHDPGKTHASFDDLNLVSRAGLVPVMALAERAGLSALVREHVSVGGPCGVNARLKAGCLVAGMAAGADSIDDMDVLRHGAMLELFGGIRAPSTLGSFLRSFSWGNVRQLDAVARRLLAELAGRAPLLPGADVLAFIDMDSMQKRVYGHAKQGAGFGHTKIQGKTLLVRGLNALAAVISTPLAAPVIAAARLRGGKANSARGAASLAAEAVSAARQAGCTGQLVFRTGLGVLLRRCAGRDPRRRGVLLGHRPDGPEDPRRDRRHCPGRLDAHHLPAGDLGRGPGTADLRRRGSRGPLHGVHLKQRQGDHPPARQNV